MQIGHRIYFDKISGAIIQDIGERQASVNVTAIAEDFAYYPALQGRSLADTDFIEIAFGTQSAEFQNKGSYHVDIPTKTLVIYPHFTFAQDKTQIAGNGVDTLTITVNTSNEIVDTINFTVNGTTQAIPTNSGQAVYHMTSSVVGTYTIDITSTYYGKISTSIGVV